LGKVACVTVEVKAVEVKATLNNCHPTRLISKDSDSRVGIVSLGNDVGDEVERFLKASSLFRSKVLLAQGPPQYLITVLRAPTVLFQP
jgi:hypothetical protein